MKLIPIGILMTLALASCTVCGPIPPVPTLKVLPLQHVAADTVARTLAQEEGSRIEIAADARQNSVVVQGSAEDLARLERRIRELDVR